MHSLDLRRTRWRNGPATQKTLTGADPPIYVGAGCAFEIGGGMFSHLVLGCLRDGKPRHGYDVCIELRARTGMPVNPGTVYRELAKLSSQGMIEAIENPRDADVRRNPYIIRDDGRHTFDRWLKAPATQNDELSSWLAFLDRVPEPELSALLERLQERLWLQTKTLTRDREDLLEQAQRNGHSTRYDVAAVRSLFQLKQVTAVLEFVQELRRLPTSGSTPRGDADRRTKK
jgi:DNA-binding PadR family transcriptional regulator